MKNASKMTTTGLVLRLFALKAQSHIIKARRASLRAELLNRIPEQLVVAGIRVRRYFQPECTYQATKAAGWRVLARRRGGKETTL